MYTSLLTLILINHNHNPELEFMFFNDEDVDTFMCRDDNDMTKHNNKDAEFAIPTFSRIRSGAMLGYMAIVHYTTLGICIN